MPFPSQHDRSEVPDEVLLDMLRSDKPDGLKEIFDRYHLRLFRLAAGVIQDDDQAKDFVQNVFVDLWNRRHTSNIRVLSHYLTRAIKFQVLKYLRNGRLQEHHLRLVQKAEFVNQTEDLLNFQELERQLAQAIEVLPPRCREIFFLSRFENLSHKQISERLSISPKTVEVQIGKALAILRSKLDGIVLLMALLFQ